MGSSDNERGNLPSAERVTAKPTFTSLVPSPTATYSPLPSPQPRPRQIVGVSPPESSVVPLNLYQADLTNETHLYEGARTQDGGYDTSVCVAFLAVPIRQEGEKSHINSEDAVPSPDRIHRVQLTVDGVVLTKVTKDLWWGPMGHTFCWHADLVPGNHTAHFQFKLPLDQVLEYTWYFVITDESIPLATWTPRL